MATVSTCTEAITEVVQSGPVLAPEGGYLPFANEKNFAAALRHELRRTERSKRPFLLLLVDLERLVKDAECGPAIPELVSALASSDRETDTAGWYSTDRVFGVIFTELNGSDTNLIVNSIKARINTLLEDKLGMARAKTVRLQFRFFPEDFQTTKKSPPDLELYGVEKQTAAKLIKRAFDIGGSLLALVILFPIFLVISVLIKLTSPGPVLYRQARIGEYGKEFVFLKFRSMYVNSGSDVHRQYVTQFIAGNAEMNASAQGKVYKLVHDSRVTAFGGFLRKTSLDELPQFMNVLKGEMSLVGPRPPLPYEFEKYDIWHRRRVVEVKPGITGLWQVSGRSKTSFEEMVRLDLQYASRWSLWLDVKILLKTPGAVMSGVGAF